MHSHFISFQLILVTLTSVSIEDEPICRHDSLTFYDGEDTDSPILKRVCGEHDTITILSNNPTMLVTFTTDESIEKTGFKMEFREQSRDTLCKFNSVMCI